MGAKPVAVQKLPDGTTQWSVDGFVATLRILAPGVVYSSAVGSGDQVFIPELAAGMAEQITAHGRVLVFVNLLGSARLGGTARDRWAEWAKKHKQHSSAHFLVRSKLVEMGISLIALFSGADLRSYGDMDRFLAAMRQAAPNAVLPKLRSAA